MNKTLTLLNWLEQQGLEYEGKPLIVAPELQRLRELVIAQDYRKVPERVTETYLPRKQAEDLRKIAEGARMPDVKLPMIDLSSSVDAGMRAWKELQMRFADSSISFSQFLDMWKRDESVSRDKPAHTKDQGIENLKKVILNDLDTLGDIMNKQELFIGYRANCELHRAKERGLAYFHVGNILTCLACFVAQKASDILAKAGNDTLDNFSFDRYINCCKGIVESLNRSTAIDLCADMGAVSSFGEREYARHLIDTWVEKE